MYYFKIAYSGGDRNRMSKAFNSSDALFFFLSSFLRTRGAPKPGSFGHKAVHFRKMVNWLVAVMSVKIEQLLPATKP